VILRVFEGHMHFPQRKRVVQPTGLVVMDLWIEDGQFLAVDFAQEHAGDKKRGKRDIIVHLPNLVNSEEILADDPEFERRFDAMQTGKRRNAIHQIDSAKTPETTAKRIIKLMQQLVLS